MLNYPIGQQRTYSWPSLSDFDYILDLVSADFSGPNHRIGQGCAGRAKLLKLVILKIEQFGLSVQCDVLKKQIEWQTVQTLIRLLLILRLKIIVYNILSIMHNILRQKYFDMVSEG